MAKNKPAQKEAEVIDESPETEETSDQMATNSTPPQLALFELEPEKISDEEEQYLEDLLARRKAARTEGEVRAFAEQAAKIKMLIIKKELSDEQIADLREAARTLMVVARPVEGYQEESNNRAKFERKQRLEKADRPAPEIRIGAFLEPLVKAVRQDLEMHPTTWVQSNDIADRKGTDSHTILKILKWMEQNGEVESQGNRRSLSFRIKQP